jgi:chemotaxis protein MotB
VNPSPPIIIIKRKGGHGGHRGGAWKVAYADFVTAMMSLFIVLWLMNSSKQIQVAVGGYFKDPTGTSKKVGTNLAGSGDNLTLTKDNIPQLREQLQKSLRQLSNFDKLKDQISMTVTAEGLRVELLESQTGTFFDTGKPEPNENGRELLKMLAEQLRNLPNKVSIEGHTDSKPYAGTGIYSNWELSTDRANAARRIMVQNGLSEGQVSQVRGFADRRLRKPEDPFDASNRRISVIVQYLPKKDEEGEEESGKPSAGIPAHENSPSEH